MFDAVCSLAPRLKVEKLETLEHNKKVHSKDLRKVDKFNKKLKWCTVVFDKNLNF